LQIAHAMLKRQGILTELMFMAEFESEEELINEFEKMTGNVPVQKLKFLWKLIYQQNHDPPEIGGEGEQGEQGEQGELGETGVA